MSHLFFSHIQSCLTFDSTHSQDTTKGSLKQNNSSVWFIILFKLLHIGSKGITVSQEHFVDQYGGSVIIVNGSIRIRFIHFQTILVGIFCLSYYIKYIDKRCHTFCLLAHTFVSFLNLFPQVQLTCGKDAYQRVVSVSISFAVAYWTWVWSCSIVSYLFIEIFITNTFCNQSISYYMVFPKLFETLSQVIFDLMNFSFTYSID